MNPVRAQIVRQASGYAWSALGAASCGDAFALKGLSLACIGLEGLSPAEAGVRDRRLSNGVILGSDNARVLSVNSHRAHRSFIVAM
jgi:hypothetical protein